MRQLAAEQNVRLIDLNSKSMEYYNSVGVDDVKTIFLWLQPGEFPNYPKGVKDNDHFQETGAYEMAGLVKDGIKELRLPISSFIVPDRIMVNVNGKLAASDIIPVDVKGRLFVPVRAMASIGLAYRWDVISRSAVITNDNKHELIFTVNDSTAYMNGDAVKLDAAPVMKDGQMLVPIRYLAEAFKISINYEKARKILFLRTIHK